MGKPLHQFEADEAIRLSQPAPVIATGTLYSTYITAIRANLDALLRLTQGLHDAEFEREAQRMLDTFDDAAIDALALLEVAEINAEAMVQSVVGMAA